MQPSLNSGSPFLHFAPRMGAATKVQVGALARNPLSSRHAHHKTHAQLGAPTAPPVCAPACSPPSQYGAPPTRDVPHAGPQQKAPVDAPAYSAGLNSASLSHVSCPQELRLQPQWARLQPPFHSATPLARFAPQWARLYAGAVPSLACPSRVLWRRATPCATCSRVGLGPSLGDMFTPPLSSFFFVFVFCCCFFAPSFFCFFFHPPGNF